MAGALEGQDQMEAGTLSRQFAQRVNGAAPDMPAEMKYLADTMLDRQTQTRDNADAIRATAEFMQYNPELTASIRDNLKTMHDQDAALLAVVREAAQNAGDPAIVKRVENLMRISNSGQFELTQSGSPELIVAANNVATDSEFIRGRVQDLLNDPANRHLAEAFVALPESVDVLNDMAGNNRSVQLQSDLGLAQVAAGIMLDGRTRDFILEGRSAIVEPTPVADANPAVRRPMQNDF